jgi:Anti-sigma factor NepR
MQFVFGADWSSSKSRSGSSSMNASILSNLGLGLRGLYQDLTEEPVPDFLALFIRELEDREQRASR